MGMYTELYLACDLKKETSEDLLKWLYSMNKPDYKITEPLAPKKLKGTRLKSFFGGSYYFYAQPLFKISWDFISNTHHLVFVFNIKNYDNEIQTLIDILMPYIDACSGEHLGHIRYEEDLLPTFIQKTLKKDK